MARVQDGGALMVVEINPSRRNTLTWLPGHSSIAREDYVQTEVAQCVEAAGLAVAARGAHPARQLSCVVARKE